MQSPFICSNRIGGGSAILRISTPRGPDVNSDDLERLLIAHTDAWNSHDIERLTSLFADDCVFDASGGPESHGRRFVGRDQVTIAFADVLDSMPDANWGDGHHHVISDDYGVSEWRLTGTLLDGSRVDVLGCDFLTVRDNKIVRKNSFRKQRPPVAD
jgi:ketosteroid isomerase-like protein